MLVQYRKRDNLKICDLRILCKDHLFEKHSPILQKTLKLKLKVTKTVYLGKPELDMNCLSSTGADKFFSRRPTFRARKKGDQNQRVRPIETQLKTLLFVIY